MFRVRRVPATTVVLCACIGAWPSFAQEGPTEEELESARLRLQQALESSGLPPAAFESDPVPHWAIPNHEPKVLPAPDTMAPSQSAKLPAERANTEVVDPNILSSQQKAEKEQKPEQKSEKPPAAQKQKPKKPAVARTKEKPKLKTGRAAADEEEKAPRQKSPQKPPAPKLVLPESLRP